MNDMNATEFCENYLTAGEVANMEPKGVTVQGVTVQSDRLASRVDASWGVDGLYTAYDTRLDAEELARRVAGEIKGQLDTIVRPEIEGKYKLKHR